ncbi:hypothetical protein B0T22DRAFT_447031 [Podospora appendiculata]|uniref:Uncharacterized protein n=1 Tax=Podospora appendiculata TaxID=314037 RepID=A0AAE0XFJ1_9PEZI|nr:hypothetical protein B0T22DRAFT_447031 [Podospora appendiculata]
MLIDLIAVAVTIAITIVVGRRPGLDWQAQRNATNKTKQNKTKRSIRLHPCCPAKRPGTLDGGGGGERGVCRRSQKSGPGSLHPSWAMYPVFGVPVRPG